MIKRIINKIKFIIRKIHSKIISMVFIISQDDPDYQIKQEIRNWKERGKPAPPPHRIKQKVIEKFKNNFDINVFVESGTYKGDMVYAMKDKFQKIFSIELSTDLWKHSVERFINEKHITILQGDSGKLLVDILPKFNEKAIFWLDGHYSAGDTARGDKDSPIIEELTAIFNSNFNHILLIDDARCFNGSDGYPTIKELSKFILSKNSHSKIKVKDDIIRVILR
jgi:hypothetical protein